MEKIYFTGALFILLFCSCSLCFGQQQREMPKQKVLEFYKQKLNIDSVKAEQIIQITLNYKSNVTNVASDQKLTPQDKGRKIKALMAEKNRQLETLLNKEQQGKIIPITERTSGDTLKLNKSH